MCGLERVYLVRVIMAFNMKNSKFKSKTSVWFLFIILRGISDFECETHTNWKCSMRFTNQYFSTVLLRSWTDFCLFIAVDSLVPSSPNLKFKTRNSLCDLYNDINALACYLLLAHFIWWRIQRIIQRGSEKDVDNFSFSFDCSPRPTTPSGIYFQMKYICHSFTDVFH